MNVKFKIGTKSKLNSQSKVEGAFYLCKDVGELYYCDGTSFILMDATNNLKSITVNAGTGMAGGGTITSTSTKVTIRHGSTDYGHPLLVTDFNPNSGRPLIPFKLRVDNFGHIYESDSYELPTKSTGAPLAPTNDGNGSYGDSYDYAAGDHIHPRDPKLKSLISLLKTFSVDTITKEIILERLNQGNNNFQCNYQTTGSYPIITVMDMDGNIITCDIKYIDSNTFEVNATVPSSMQIQIVIYGAKTVKLSDLLKDI